MNFDPLEEDKLLDRVERITGMRLPLRWRWLMKAIAETPEYQKHLHEVLYGRRRLHED